MTAASMMNNSQVNTDEQLRKEREVQKLHVFKDQLVRNIVMRSTSPGLGDGVEISESKLSHLTKILHGKNANKQSNRESTGREKTSTASN